MSIPSSIARHLEKKKKLSEKLDFLTNLSLRTKEKDIFAACEELRHELCRELTDPQVIRKFRKAGTIHYMVILTDGRIIEVVGLESVKKIMELNK